MSCVNIYLLFFFFRESFTMNHLVFFPRGKVGSESFSVIAKLDPIH